MKGVFLLPGAQAELEGAADWYEARREGLGLRFVLEVDQALKAIENTPAAFAEWDADPRFRKFVLRRFPFLVFYRETEERIEVVAVAHGAREPAYWRKRK